MAMPSLQQIFVECSIFGRNTCDLLPQAMPPNLPVLKLSNIGGRGVKSTLSHDECMRLASALAEWIKQKDSPQGLDIKLMTHSAPPKFTSAIVKAWSDAGRDKAALHL